VSHALSLPTVQTYRPATFQERGVAVPFTTPLLTGARARHGTRCNVELVVRNPSGGQGYYIVPCASIRSLCRLTVHDSRLNRIISSLPVLTPSTVRQAALAVAAQGLAGRPAMAAGQAALAKDRQDRISTEYLLLGALAEQTAPEAFKGLDWRRHPSMEVERQTQRIVAELARSRNQSPDALSSTLEALAETFAPIGIVGQLTEARLPRLLRDVTAMHAALTERSRATCEGVLFELTDMVASRAGPITTASAKVLNATKALTRDVAGLLHSWSRSRERVLELAAKPDWLLDGWEEVCLLWRSSRSLEQQRATMIEMAHRMPVLPREIEQWGALAAIPSEAVAGQLISFDQKWRAGPAMLNLTARNERLRASAV
jgi:hypothetical protein